MQDAGSLFFFLSFAPTESLLSARQIRDIGADTLTRRLKGLASFDPLQRQPAVSRVQSPNTTERVRASEKEHFYSVQTALCPRVTRAVLPVGEWVPLKLPKAAGPMTSFVLGAEELSIIFLSPRDQRDEPKPQNSG